MAKIGTTSETHSSLVLVFLQEFDHLNFFFKDRSEQYERGRIQKSQFAKAVRNRKNKKKQQGC